VYFPESEKDLHAGKGTYKHELKTNERNPVKRKSHGKKSKTRATKRRRPKETYARASTCRIKRVAVWQQTSVRRTKENGLLRLTVSTQGGAGSETKSCVQNDKQRG